jgi:UDP-N-acetylglucosamine:LPS N-acetylglucosamine transferase
MVLGHGHPRIMERLLPIYDALDIEPVYDFEEVLERADCYVCDNSSTMFEFASTGRPVVVLNPPWYRREVNHGLRFWEAAGVGVNCDRPQDLAGAVATALQDPPPQREAGRSLSPTATPTGARRSGPPWRSWS